MVFLIKMTNGDEIEICEDDLAQIMKKNGLVFVCNGDCMVNTFQIVMVRLKK